MDLFWGLAWMVLSSCLMCWLNGEKLQILATWGVDVLEATDSETLSLDCLPPGAQVFSGTSARL